MPSGTPSNPGARHPSSESAGSAQAAGAQRRSLSQAVDLLLTMGAEVETSDPPRALDCFQQAAELAANSGDRAARGRALLRCGRLETQRGHFAAAEQFLEDALALARAADQDLDAARCLNGFGLLRLRQGHAAEALPHLRESLRFTASGQPGEEAGSVRADTLQHLGSAYVLTGDTAQALRYHQETLELRRAAGDRRGIATALNHLGNLRHRMGQNQEAVDCYRQALEPLHALEDPRAIAGTTNNLASTLMRLGAFDEARRLFAECRDLFGELDDPARVADVLTNLGLLDQGQGRLAEAEAHYREALRVHRELGNAASESNALTNLSYLAVARGRLEEALEWATESLTLHAQHDLQGTLAPALLWKGHALLGLERWGAARAAAQESCQAARRAQATDQLADARALEACICCTRGDLVEALAAAEEALNLAEATEDPELLAATCRCVGRVQIARGDLDAAKTALGRAARLLRGWEHSYERARVLYDEGVLLTLAGAAQGGAERLRRAESEFTQMGNVRWRIKTLLKLAEVVAPGDRAQAAVCRRAAEQLGEQHGLNTLIPPPATGSSPLAGLDSLAQAFIARTAGSVGVSSCARQFCDPLFSFLRGELSASCVVVRWHDRAAQHWARADDESPERLVDPPDCPGPAPEDARHMTVLGPPGKPAGDLLVARSGDEPWTEAERETLALAARMLTLALAGELAGPVPGPPPPEPALKEGRFEHLVGSSRPMKDIYRLIAQVAPAETSVLILGESGTGKELVARSIHARSRRAGGPFVAISCPSIPRDLIESELFGHERGAFTGAVGARPGKIEMASGGTLFLDEVGDMPLPTQAKILRFLQERELQRVGGRRNIAVDVRLLSATSRDLEAARASGEFREDLYYRLGVVPLSMPPLRERREDIPLLVEHFLAQLAQGEQGRRVRISAGALDRLLAHSWPGNVRELRNAVEYMTTVCADDRIELRNLPAALLEAREGIGQPQRLRPGETLESRLMDLEAGLIRKALDAADWNQSAAARSLGATESKIRGRMKRYGIKRSRRT